MLCVHLLWKIAAILVLIPQEGWKFGTTQDVSGNNVRQQNGSKSVRTWQRSFYFLMKGRRAAGLSEQSSHVITALSRSEI